MPFSILLLTSASSERHISGHGGDRLIMNNLEAKEVALFFDKIDEVRESLGMGKQEKCCDGVIFYTRQTGKQSTRDALKLICLVEMKSDNVQSASEQILSTYNHLVPLLKDECKACLTYLNRIVWCAYIYRSGTAPKDSNKYIKKLTDHGFKRENVALSGNRDIAAFLRDRIK